MQISLNNITANLRNSLFWDVEINKIDAIKNAPLIIERVLERGNKFEFAAIVNLYGEHFFIEQAKKIKTLDEKNINYLSTVFGLQKDEFRCYKRSL